MDIQNKPSLGKSGNAPLKTSMNKFFCLLMVLFTLLNATALAIVNDVPDKDYSECVNVIKKYPYIQFIESLKQNNDFFVAVITYNSTWGMFPSYIYLRNPVCLGKNKQNIVMLGKKRCEEISVLAKKYIDFGGQVFVKGGRNSLPAIFHVVVVYDNGAMAKFILSQVSNKTTGRYENNTYTDNPSLFLSQLAILTNSDGMFESIYGFLPNIN